MVGKQVVEIDVRHAVTVGRHEGAFTKELRGLLDTAARHRVRAGFE